MMSTTDRAIIFLGPSLSHQDAGRILAADYRPPIRRGDLDGIPAGRIVGIVDGVFEQDLAVSPEEVHLAIQRGVIVYGGSSMGALRAAEVRGVIGVGQVFEWYRDGIVSRDDEVALIFDPINQRPMTVPTVCVRFSVDRLLRTDTLDAAAARALIAAAERLGFKERTYVKIVEEAGLAGRIDSDDLIAMLSAQDIKANDAQAVLEAIDLRQMEPSPVPATSLRHRNGEKFRCGGVPEQASDTLLIWESGDRVAPEELLRFLIFTGKRCFPAQLAMSAEAEFDPEVLKKDAQKRFNAAAKRWGWMSSEEANVTLADLGLDQETLGEGCLAEAIAEQQRKALQRCASAGLAAAVKANLFLDDMALKRETLRVAALSWFAARMVGDPNRDAVAEAKATITRLLKLTRFDDAVRHLSGFGIGRDEIEDFIESLAKARLVGGALRDRMSGAYAEAPPSEKRGFGLGLGSCVKPEGELRHCRTLDDAEPEAHRLAARIGITRIGMIGELGDLGGIQIAQASRPGNAWSSSYGSGKSRTREGAVVGAVMEECEKWAQEAYAPQVAAEASFNQLVKSEDVVDPGTLDLPYDSPYHPDLTLSWVRVVDMMRSAEVLVPRDPLTLKRSRHDIFYSARGARKHIATNGLGAGFTLEEAVLHGLCEYVERHTQRIAELYCSNPGGLGVQPFHFVDPCNLAPQLDQIMDALRPRADAVRVLDITGEIAIPTYMAALVRNGRVANGFGTHPNPLVAMESALLEASQTIASAIAGGREDLSIKARSLGRHERPRPADPNSIWFWLDPDAPQRPLAADKGCQRDDVFDEIAWALGQLSKAGVGQVLVCDLSHPTIAPIRVARVVIPGLETNNPFHFGPRARLTVLRDLLPRMV